MYRKRILSLLLAVGLTFGTFPTAFAAETGADNAPVELETVQTQEGQQIPEESAQTTEGQETPEEPAQTTEGQETPEEPAQTTEGQETSEEPATSTPETSETDTSENTDHSDTGISDDLARMTWANVKWEMVSGTMENEIDTDTPLLYQDETEDENGRGNWIDILASREGSAEAEAEFTFTRPESLSDVDGLVARYGKFRPGMPTSGYGPAFEDIVELDENGSFVIPATETDGSWAYRITFGVGTDESDFTPYSYEYGFRLSVRSLMWMRWDDISVVETSSEIATEHMWPNIKYGELFNEGSDYSNYRSVGLKDDESGEKVSATFSIRAPYEAFATEGLIALVNGKPQELTDRQFTITVNEDNPADITVQFGLMEGEIFAPVTYAVPLGLSVQHVAPMTWDDVSLDVLSGTLDSDHHGPETDELLIDGSGWNRSRPMVFPENDDPVAVAFRIRCPEGISGNSADLMAKAIYYWDWEPDNQYGLTEYSSGDSYSFEVWEDEPIECSIQFGTGTDAEDFRPLTYAYKFRFEAAHVEPITWENIGWDKNIQADYTRMTPYSYELEEKTPLNHGSSEEDNMLYLPVMGKEVGDKVAITVSCPEKILNEPGIYARYTDFTGETQDKMLDDGKFTFDVKVVPVGQESNIQHCFWFRNEEKDRLSGSYLLKVTAVKFDPLTWENITYEPHEGTEADEIQFGTDILKYPEENEIVADSQQFKYDGYGLNAFIIPITSAPSGSMVDFKVSCPTEWDRDQYDVSVMYYTNLRGAQNGDTAIYPTPDLKDGVLSIPVDVSKLFPTRWHRMAFYLKDSDGNLIAQTPIYSFDFVAKDDFSAVVDTTTEVANGVANSTVEKGDIAEFIKDNPKEDNIFVNAVFADGGAVPYVSEANVTLSKTDADAVVEADKGLEIATPAGTITLPSEAVAQTMEDAEDDASLRLKVSTQESENVGDDSTRVEIVEVTLHRVDANGEESGAISIKLSGGKVISVTVVSQKQTPVIVVYLPKDGKPAFHQQVENINDRVTFDTSHLSEFELLSYEEALQQGLLGTTKRRRPSSSSSSKDDNSDKVSVDLRTGRNGSVDLSPSRPSSGDRVTLTVTPDAGYVLDIIEVTRENGGSVSLTEKETNVYTFTMPSDDITIKTTFVHDGSGPEPAPAQETANTSFLDVVPSEWYAASVSYVAEHGIMAGSSGYFTPNSSLTRAMIAQILCNLDGAAAVGASQSFPDVSVSDWFSGAVSQAVSMGYMNGYGSGLFGPNDPITREQLASVLYSYAQAKGLPNTRGSGSAADTMDAFADRASVSGWAEDAVHWAVGAGLISGKSGGRLDPTGTASRAEVAQILMNFQQNIVK